MLDDDTTSPGSTTADPTEATETSVRRTRRRSASRPAGPPEHVDTPPAETGEAAPPAKKTAAKRTAKKTTTRTAAKKAAPEPTTTDAAPSAVNGGAAEDAIPTEAAGADATAPAKKATRKRATKKQVADDAPAEQAPALSAPFAPLFVPPEPSAAPKRKRAPKPETPEPAEAEAAAETAAVHEETTTEQAEGTSRRRRSRGGRNRRRSGGEAADQADSTTETEAAAAVTVTDDKDTGAEESEAADSEQAAGSSRRRRRRRRGGDDTGDTAGEAVETTARKRESRAKETITGVEGSTRIEAKKQRRREGREAGRRRPPILSESEFLARRESVDRVMTIRQRGETTQIAVLEDNVLVEHYVALESQNSIIGNVYLGRVQNVLPSMEAAFIDIGKGRNAVLYAGEVNWDLVGDRNQPRRIENALKPGQSILVQVSKDPVGHKGARLTSQISLPGRYLVYVPAGGTSGISRKLPDTERNRLKNLLKEVLPEDAGVIVRTAAEGASEDELTRDVNRLTARWEDIDKKSKNGQAPALLYAEPDTTLKVVRDLFTEDFAKLVISGVDAWDMVEGYVQHVAPDLSDRLERFDGDGDVFTNYRVDEQIAKALDRKVWLPSGGSLVIDRTEAMTVVDVNTGKFTGSGGNLEETVTKNNLEAAEEIVRQLRLRDIGGIIVIDFIDMVLEDNRDLVLRRLVECLGRDRTRHQVAEVTSLGLVQMTRKRISTGLLEAFSHSCEHCQGRGVVVETEPVVPKASEGGRTDGKAGGGSGAKRTTHRRRGRKGDQEPDTDTEHAAAPESAAPESAADAREPEPAAAP